MYRAAHEYPKTEEAQNSMSSSFCLSCCISTLIVRLTLRHTHPQKTTCFLSVAFFSQKRDLFQLLQFSTLTLFNTYQGCQRQEKLNIVRKDPFPAFCTALQCYLLLSRMYCCQTVTVYLLAVISCLMSEF